MTKNLIELIEVDSLKKVVLSKIIVFCLITLGAYGQIKWDSTKFMPLSEVKTGMMGEAYTVFSGTTVEKFDFEVVSIQHDFAPQWDVIWVEASGKNFERTGGAGGMSGSPGYINGRLMGALSLAYFHQRENANIVGFTPIESMIDVTHRGMKPNLSYRGSNLFNFGSNVTQNEINLLHFPFDERKKRESSISHRSVFSSTTKKSSRLKIPVTFSAIGAQAVELLEPFLAKHRFHLLQAAGGASPVKPAPIEPGQIIGIEFARGDLTMFSYGTMTYVENDQVHGFGHRAFGEGNVNLPVSGGYVHFILPSITRSFKVAAPTEPIGTLVQDRQTGIAALLGSSPTYIPVHANIETTDGRNYPMHYEVIRHRGYTPLVAMVGALNLMNAVEMTNGDHTVHLKTSITLKDQPNLISRKIVRENVYSSSFSPAVVVSQALSPLSTLIGNNYTKVSVERVVLNVKLEDKRRSAVVEALRINKNRYRPGSDIEITVTLRPYLESPITHLGRITIPKDCPEGLATLLATSATAYESFQRTRAPLNYNPRDINQLIEFLQRAESNKDVILALFVPNQGMTIQGKEFSGLPLSVMSVLSMATQVGEAGYTLGTTLHVDNLSTEHVISGSRFVRFAVDSNAP